jgi:predicted CXXCH cytochrome family protein
VQGGLWDAIMLVAIALTLLVLPSEQSRAGIRGSAHDFSPLAENQEICIFCHTPHGADTTVVDAPLWNHQVTQKIYQVYNSATLDASVGQPSASSRLCLSCHDGTVAVDSYGGRSGVIFLGGKFNIGGDAAELKNDHPISFTYDDTLATKDGGLFSPSTTPSGLGHSIAQDLLLGGKVECASCHDVHNSGPAAAVNDSLLVITRAQSRLCLTCHDK